MDSAQWAPLLWTNPGMGANTAVLTPGHLGPFGHSVLGGRVGGSPGKPCVERDPGRVGSGDCGGC